MKHSAKALTILVIALLWFVGCGGEATPTKPPADLANPTEPTPAETPVDEPASEEASPSATASFEEAPCPFYGPGDGSVECGFVVVPEDHSNPHGRTIRLAVAVFKDYSSGRQPDPVILLSGGPGEKVMHVANQLAQGLAALHPHRDLIVFDQRGVGLSEPALECPGWTETQFDLLDEADTEVSLKRGFEALMACRDRLEGDGINLSLYTTAQNAADVDAIRAALGYDQLNLYGGSYGTLLAQAVMRDFPQGVRSAVLSSVLPLEKSIFIDSTTTSKEAMMKLLDACAADEECDQAYPDLEEVLFEVVERLNTELVSLTVTNPLNGESYETILGGIGMFNNLVVLLYRSDLIPALPQAIYDVYKGDYSLMTQLLGQNLIFFDALSRGMEFSVLCSDDLAGRTPEDLLAAREMLPEPLLDDVEPDLLNEYGVFGLCENWPTAEASPSVKAPLVSDIPVLLLAGEFDPVTPPEYGQLVASYLENSIFFEFPGLGHTITSDECVRTIAGSFIEAPTQQPQAGCVAQMAEVDFDVPAETMALTLEPFTDNARGFSGLVPVGWKALSPANLKRDQSALDPAYFVLEAAQTTAANLFSALAGQLGIDPAAEPETTAEVGSYTWDFYTFEVQGHPADLALAQGDGKAYFVLLISPVDERESLYEQLFLPAVEAMQGIG